MAGSPHEDYGDVCDRLKMEFYEAQVSQRVARHQHMLVLTIH